MTTSGPATVTRIHPFAIPFLGILGAVQGSAPNIASTALVGAGRGLDMSGSTLALAASMQTLAIAASVITTGLLADRLGRRRVLIAGLFVGISGSLTVALAPVAAFYLLGQALIGVGLGAVYGSAFAYIRAVSDPAKLPAAIGVFSAVVGMATLVLTFTGGALSGIDWRIAYLVIPVVSALCVILTPLILPPQPPLPKNEKNDIVGQVLLAAGLVAFLFGVSKLATSLSSPGTLVPLFGGVALIGAFAWWESRTPHPFFPIRLFTRPVFIAAILAGLVYNFGTAVGFLQVTNLWQYITGLNTTEVSLWQLPMMASGIVAALIFGRLMARGLSNRFTIVIGAALSGVGFILLAGAHASHTLWEFLPGLIVLGMGVLTASLPYGSLIIKEAPADFYGPVTSSRTTFGQLFYSMGLAVSTVVIDQLTRGGTVTALEKEGVQPNQIGTALDAVNAFASRSTAPTTSLGQQALAAAATSYQSSFVTMMLIAAAVCVFAGAGAFVLLTKSEKSVTETSQTSA